MVTAPRYENTRLHKQDEKALLNPHYVAIAMITESCIEIIFSVILLIGVIKASYRWLLPWIAWCFFNILYIFVIAVMQVLAAVFASVRLGYVIPVKKVDGSNKMFGSNGSERVPSGLQLVCNE
nr:uncharacterized protein LOC119181018 [Rhipicephalus microplus]